MKGQKTKLANVIWLSKNDQGRLSIISVDANYNIQTLTTNSTSEALHKLTTITKLVLKGNYS